jgi:hypothetical protein
MATKALASLLNQDCHCSHLHTELDPQFQLLFAASLGHLGSTLCATVKSCQTLWQILLCLCPYWTHCWPRVVPLIYGQLQLSLDQWLLQMLPDATNREKEQFEKPRFLFNGHNTHQYRLVISQLEFSI